VEGQAGADPGARTPIGIYFELDQFFYIFLFIFRKKVGKIKATLYYYVNIQ
jgi:hypothetical protein